MKVWENIKNSILDFIRPVLSDKIILKYNQKGLLIEDKLSPSQVQPNSIDLTLANGWKKPKHNWIVNGIQCIDTGKEIHYNEGFFERNNDIWELASSKPYYVLRPGEFVLMASREVLNIPNGILSFVQGRSSIARLAIQTEQAGLIDAGFQGTITFEVKNEGDNAVILYEGMRVAQVYFFKSQYAIHPYGSKNKGSKYQMQIQATGSKIHLDPELRK